MYRHFLTAAVVIAASGAMAQDATTGDPEKGEKAFRKCKACHTIVSADGEEIVRGGKTGPNLWGVPGRVAGTTDFNYGPSIVEAGEKGLVWDAENLDSYLKDPKKFLQSYLGDKRAKSKMVFKLKSGRDDIWAYLVSVSGSAAATDSDAGSDQDGATAD